MELGELLISIYFIYNGYDKINDNLRTHYIIQQKLFDYETAIMNSGFNIDI